MLTNNCRMTIGTHSAIKVPGELLTPNLGGYEPSEFNKVGTGADAATLAQFVNASMYSATSCRMGSER